MASKGEVAVEPFEVKSDIEVRLAEVERRMAAIELKLASSSGELNLDMHEPVLESSRGQPALERPLHAGGAENCTEHDTEEQPDAAIQDKEEMPEAECTKANDNQFVTVAHFYTSDSLVPGSETQIRRHVRSLLQSLEEQVHHKVHNTVWEAILLSGTPVLGRMGSVSLALSFIVNLALQLTVCIVIQLGFTKSQILTVNEAQEWR